MAEEQEWANLLGEIFEKLTQKHASITYDFENLEMKGQVEKESKIVPTGSVSLTGKLTITAQWGRWKWVSLNYPQIFYLFLKKVI